MTTNVVRIYGSASNLAEAPNHIPSDTEVWCCNDPRRGHRQQRRTVMSEWTHWFNLHSERHMRSAYPLGYDWYCTQRDPSKTIILQKVHSDIPLSRAFEKDEIMARFATRYFTCSVTWFMARAAYLQVPKVELYGFYISSAKEKYWFERPCFWYWIDRLKKMGIEVEFPKVLLTNGSTEIGDAASYTGPLYGYETT